jgi:lipoprotein NlpD
MKLIKFYKLHVLLSILMLTGCDSRSSFAPVVELKWQPYNVRQLTHIVQRGETLYAVAFRYDQDYQQLAAINHLHSPYALRVGQVLHIKTLGEQPSVQQIIVNKLQHSSLGKTKQHYTSMKTIKPSSSPRGQWSWPVNGRVAARFLPQQGKKGIDIAGKRGEKVRAASGGIVAYAGNGLSGYGNLIIIKHNNQFLTAYGNNLRNVVAEGQKVKAGQIIAEMGVIDRRFWGVHFEIRKAGKPVDPLNYLQRG